MIAIVTNLRSIYERHRSIRVNINRRLTFCSLTGYSNLRCEKLREIEELEPPAMHVREASVSLSLSSKTMTKKLTFQGVKVPFAANFSFLFLSPFFFSFFSFLFAVFSSLFEGSGVTKVIDLRGASSGPPRTSNQRHIFQRIRAARRQEEISTTSNADRRSAIPVIDSR